MSPKMTKTITLSVDATILARLEDLTDYYGEKSIEDTLQLLIRCGHVQLKCFIAEEIGQSGERVSPREPQPYDEIPM